MQKNTVNIDIEVSYYWYDHLILRKNGDAKIVTEAIENGDYDTFMKYYKKYEDKYDYYNEEEESYMPLIFFPDEACIWYHDNVIGYINITNPIGFSLITSNEYECG